MIFNKQSSNAQNDINLIHREIRRAFDLPTTSRQRPQKLRSSLLPYCGLREYYHWLRDEQPAPFNLLATMYMDIGTAVHEVLQQHLPKTFNKLNVIADWIPCQRSKCPYHKPFPKYSPQTVSSAACPRCGEHPKHREIKINDAPASSHIDGLYVIGNTKRTYIIDYKTTGKSSLNSIRDGRYTHGIEYYWQLVSYVNNIHDDLKKHGYELCGALLIYFERDAPINFHIVPVDVDLSAEGMSTNRDILNRMSTGHDLQTKVLGAAEQELMDRDSCHAAANMLNETKTCTDRQFHDHYIESKWKGPCALAHVCFDKKNRNKEMENAIDAYIRERSLRLLQNKDKG